MSEKLNTWFIATQFRLRQAFYMCLATRLNKIIAYLLVYGGVVARKFGKRSLGLKLILKGRRAADIVRANKIIGEIAHQNIGIKTEFDELLENGVVESIDGCETRILILKLPTLSETKVIEKGALIIKFSETFIPIYFFLNVKLLTKYFRVILEPSWVGYSIENILAWTALSPEKVVVLASYKSDFDLLSSINTNLIPITLGSADWVDTSIFDKIPSTEKIYDAIYVANFDPIKRVDRYRRAIWRISRKRPGYKAVLVCAEKTGSAKREVLATLESYGSDGGESFEYIPGLDQASLNVMFSKSKVNVLVSLREGQNKGLAEGLFCGTPALLIEENVGGNHIHINEMTGRVVPDAELENTLEWFADHYTEFAPDEWAISHISPKVSTNTLSQMLKKIELSEGRQWTGGLFVKVNRPELAYLEPRFDWLLDKREELLTVFTKGEDEKNVIKFLKQLVNVDPTRA